MADELLDLENQIVAESVGLWAAEVERIKKEIVKIGVVNETDPATAIQQALALLHSIEVPEMSAAAAIGVAAAYEVGVSAATQALPKEDRTGVVPFTNPDALAAVGGLELRALDSVRKAITQLGGSNPATLEELVTTIAPITRESANMVSAVTWAVNTGHNDAAAQVAQVSGYESVWVPERNACLDCTAYAGEVSEKGVFPQGLTFAAKPVNTGPLTAPPLHPNCRCTVRPLIHQSYADGLKREAVRSVLRGTALPGESEKSRLAAASRLLEQDPTAPASVKKYAERAIKRGTFK